MSQFQRQNNEYLQKCWHFRKGFLSANMGIPETILMLVKSLISKTHFVSAKGFFWRKLRPSRKHSTYGDVTITGEGLKSLNYTRHLWPMNSEVSSACHSYFDTGNPFIMFISEDPWHPHLLPSAWQWSCHYLFSRLGSDAVRIRTRNHAHARRTLWPTAPLRRFQKRFLKIYMAWLSDILKSNF